MRALDFLSRTGDATFAVDGDGSIVGWNVAAERLLGFRPDEALGRTCQQVLYCQDLLGRELCAEGCHLVQAIRQGTLSPAIDLVVHDRDGHTVQVGANVMLVPGECDARALVLLRPSPGGIVETPTGSTPWSGRSDGLESCPSLLRLDLAGSLGRLLTATGADAAELFLTTPGGNELVLAAHYGQAARAFRQIVTFERGQGFPGLVAQAGEPLISLDLPRDNRYLRSAVKHHGFRSYLCVPIWGSVELLGSLHIASRQDPATVAPQISFLTQVSRHIALALEHQRLDLAQAVAGQLLDPSADAGENLRQTAEQVLRSLIEVAAADSGAILLRDHSSGVLQPVSDYRLPPRLHRMLARASEPNACPALARGRCVLLSDAEACRSAICGAVRRDLHTTVCVPLAVGDEPLGVVVLGCGRREPLPTRRLTFLHAAVQGSAALLHRAIVAVSVEQSARWQASEPDGAAPALRWPAPGKPAEACPAEVSGRRAFLDLRCLGRFRLASDGRPIPPERFQRRSALTLLKILLTRYGKSAHREELIELLWPEAQPGSAHGLLSVVVHSLRRALEPSRPSARSSSFIRTSGEYYAFDTDSPHRLDTQEFLQAATLAKQLEVRDRRQEALLAYERAITLYTGDLFEDERYSDWCGLEREFLRESVLTVLRRAARLHLALGKPDAAVGCYRRAVAIEATLEDVHRALMELLWRAGRRDEALRQYLDCRAVLERELGVAPGAKTEALRRQIVAVSSPLHP